MKREDLKALGIADDLLDKVMALHGKDIEAEKLKLTSLQTEVDGVKTQLTDANKAIDSFKSLDVEGIKKAAADWEIKAKKAETDSATKIAQIEFDHALDAALSGNVNDTVSVKAHLKLDGLKLNPADKTILGLKEQLDPMKTSLPHLFKAAEGTPEFVAGTSSKTKIGTAFDAALRQGAGLPPTKEG